MPGHEKKGPKGSPDPDPSPYLIVSYEEKQKDLAKVRLSEMSIISTKVWKLTLSCACKM